MPGQPRWEWLASTNERAQTMTRGCSSYSMSPQRSCSRGVQWEARVRLSLRSACDEQLLKKPLVLEFDA
jgi:hypothetical protein